MNLLIEHGIGWTKDAAGRLQSATPAEYIAEIERLTLKCAALAKEMDQFNLIFAMRAVAKVLEAPRDRLGRLDIALASEEIREARETVRGLAVHYGVTGGKDILEQCAKVLRASVSCVEKH